MSGVESRPAVRKGAILRKYEARVAEAGSLVCVGLDSELERLPRRFHAEAEPQFAFNRWIIEQTAEFASAFKLNTAFYEARGAQGWREMARTVEFLRAEWPEVVTICDAKRADIGNTNAGYVRAIFDELGFDAVTLHPYLGREALVPFLARDDKASIVLCRTSNPGAGELQDLVVNGEPLWRRVARTVQEDWNAQGNCMLVVGATWPEEMREVRAVAPDLPLLVPGVGAQGGNVRAVVHAGLGANPAGLMISSSRAILFAESPAKAARELREEIAAAQALPAELRSAQEENHAAH